MSKWKGSLLPSRRQSISITVVVLAYLPLPGHTSRAINIQFSSQRSYIKAFGVLSAHWRIFIRPIQSIANDRLSSCCSRQLVMPNKLLGICAGGFVDWYDSTGKLKEGKWRWIKDCSMCWWIDMRWIRDGLYSICGIIQFVLLFVECNLAMNWRWIIIIIIVEMDYKDPSMCW